MPIQLVSTWLRSEEAMASKQKLAASADAGGAAQLPPTVEALRALVACSEVQAVDIVRIAVDRNGVGDPGFGPLPVPANWQTSVAVPELQCPMQPSPQGAAVIVSIEATWHDGAGHTFAKAQVAVRVSYQFAGLAVTPSFELVAMLARELGLHHAWPFLREKLRSISGEFGLPAVVLPLRKR